MIRKDIVYIAGPMTGLAGFNRSSFTTASIFLTTQGYEVRNPGCLPTDWANYDHYMEVALIMLEQCDQIVFLPGSAHSKGATVEWGFAEANGIPASAMLLTPIMGDLIKEFVANGGKL